MTGNSCRQVVNTAALAGSRRARLAPWPPRPSWRLASNLHRIYSRAVRPGPKAPIMNLQSTVPLHSGNRIPVLGLGTWQLTDDTAATVARALELGYPMIDTSGDYGTQPGIGEAIRRSGVSRESFYLVTKVEETDNAYHATRRNLAELELEYADLILIHRPPEDGVGAVLWEGLLQAKR